MYNLVRLVKSYKIPRISQGSCKIPRILARMPNITYVQGPAVGAWMVWKYYTHRLDAHMLHP